jgi:probable O-glycosylation ligase (exosortase A-associated)
VLILAVVLALPLCFARPWIGMLIYMWLTCMQPFRYASGAAYDFPAIRLVALATLVGLPFTRERYRLPWRAEVALIAALLVLFTCTTWWAPVQPIRAQAKWLEVMKIAIMAGAALVLLQDRRKLRSWLLIIALSLGYYGITGGVWALQTGLSTRLYGPPGSFIYDNNALGFVFTMVLPLLAFLHIDEDRRWMRYVLLATFGLMIIALFATYSRASFIGFVVVSASIVVLIRTQSKLLLAVGAMACLSVYFAPKQWVAERMQTITPSAYRVDSSGAQRMKSWYVAWRLGLEHPVFGAGFHPFLPEVYERYIPGYSDNHDAHNHCLQMLAEFGFTGLLLFVALLVSVVWRLLRTAWTNRGDPHRVWIVRYAQMILISLLAYIVGGVFINQPHAELLYSLIAAALILDAIATAPGAEGPGVVGESIVGEVMRRARITRR